MCEALRLARRGLGRVEPNPMVGAVLVHEGQIVARGWHRRFGQAHAEVELLRTKGLAFDPDVVVVVFVDNDFNNSNAGMHAFASKPPRPAIVNRMFRRS